MTTGEPEPTQRFQPDRLKMISDGVFAVGLTLLILDIRPPEVSPAHLTQALESIVPQLGVFALSFAIVAYYWVIHHLIFLYVRSAGRGLLWSNLLFLFTIVVLPFSASLLGRYPLAPVALTFYGLNVAGCSLTLWLTWVTALRTGHIADAHPRQRRYIMWRFALSPTLAIVGVGLARVAPAMSLIMFVAVPVVYAVTSGPRRAR